MFLLNLRPVKFIVCSVLFGIPVLMIPGCSEQPASTPVTATPAAPVATENDQSQKTEVLGGKLQRDEDGYIIDLDLRGTEATDEDLSAFVSLQRLRSVHLDKLPITDQGIQTLATYKGPLVNLDLRECQLSNAAMETLATISTLRAIRLSGTGNATSADDTGIAKLSALKQLKVLAVDQLWVSTAALQELLQAKTLEELYLKGTLVDDDSMAVVSQFPSLKKLRISSTQVGNAGLEHLTACKNLEELDLSENSLIDDNGLQYVGRMTSLKKLNLWRDAVSDAGIAHLSSLTGLTWLNLDNTQLSDGGLSALHAMKSLTFLHLGSTSISDSGLPQLEHLTALKDLKVTRTAVTEAGVQALQAKLPNTAIQLKYIEGE